MTVTVTEATRATLRDYVAHRRELDGTVTTVKVQAATVARALLVSGLGSARIHDGRFTDCVACRTALDPTTTNTQER